MNLTHTLLCGIMTGVSVYARTPTAVPRSSHIGNDDFRIELASGNADEDNRNNVRFDRVARVKQITIDGRNILSRLGLADEFGIRGDGVLGFAEASPGEEFLKIGVGTLVKGKSELYDYDHVYEVKTLFPVSQALIAPNHIRYRQAGNLNGWKYLYEKNYIADPARQILLISYQITNQGNCPFYFEHYNHHFWKIGKKADAFHAFIANNFQIQPEKTIWATVTPTGIRLKEDRKSSRRYYQCSVNTKQKSWETTIQLHTNPLHIKISGDSGVTRFAFYWDSVSLCPEIFFKSPHIKPRTSLRWNVKYQFMR